MKYFVEKEDFIFNTRVYQKICYDNNDIKTKEIEEIAEKATKLMRQFEEKLSFFYESSEVSSINENASNGFIKISNDTFEILKKSIYYSKLTNGIFDITIAPLVKAWAINSDNPTILSKEKIDELNNTHQEAVKTLNEYKKEKLEQIAKEFEENVNSKGTITNTYESQIKEISDKYEELIVKEKERQANLRYKIDLNIKNIDEEKTLYEERLAELKNKFNEDKEVLEKMHLENIDRENQIFLSEQEAELEETSNVTNDIDTINKKIDEINQKFNVINDEIDMKRFAVITIFTNKMQEIDDYYNSLVNDNNNRRKQVDVMNNKVATIFKKN